MMNDRTSQPTTPAPRSEKAAGKSKVATAPTGHAEGTYRVHMEGSGSEFGDLTFTGGMATEADVGAYDPSSSGAALARSNRAVAAHASGLVVTPHEGSDHSSIGGQRPPSDPPPEAKERYVFLRELLTRGVDLFGSLEETNAWLRRPALGLGNRVPFDLVGTEDGRKELDDFVGRLEYGVYT